MIPVPTEEVELHHVAGLALLVLAGLSRRGVAAGL